MTYSGGIPSGSKNANDPLATGSFSSDPGQAVFPANVFPPATASSDYSLYSSNGPTIVSNIFAHYNVPKSVDQLPFGFGEGIKTIRNRPSGSAHACSENNKERKFQKKPSGEVTFDPLTISGATLWLDAKDASTLTVDGSNRISEWRDKSGATYTHVNSGNHHHLIQNTANNQPTYVPAGGTGAFSSKGGAVSVGDVGGSATYIDSQYAWGTTPSGHEATQFFVVSKRAHAGAGFAYPNWFYVGNFLFGYRYNDGSGWTNTRIRAGSSANLNSTSDAVIGTKYLYTMTHKGTGVADTLRINAVEEVASVDINANLDATNTYHRIGSNLLTTIAEAEVAEILFYDSILSDTDRDAVEAYLTGKWGI